MTVWERVISKVNPPGEDTPDDGPKVTAVFGFEPQEPKRRATAKITSFKLFLFVMTSSPIRPSEL